jgi:aldose 1-epimerase
LWNLTFNPTAALYTSSHSQDVIELYNPSTGNRARFDLSQGGRCTYLAIAHVPVITDPVPVTYSSSYAGSILFPFVNRIKDGKYRFRESEFVLDINNPEYNCALHGLVYNKEFKLQEIVTKSDYASLTLYYLDEGLDRGFPFKSNLEIIYTLTSHGLKMSIMVTNMDHKAFPFSLGWHPYFQSENLAESTINFQAAMHIENNEQLIPLIFQPVDKQLNISLKGRSLDDAFQLSEQVVNFKTPRYTARIHSSASDGYFQFYTPPAAPNHIAIEPMTAVADSFNNKHGLHVLDPSNSYEAIFQLDIEV